MIDRMKFYDKIFRNKTVVKRIQSYSFIPSIDELMIEIYYSYNDIEDKIPILEELISLEEIPNIDGDKECSIKSDIKNIINKYKDALSCLYNNQSSNNIYYILTDINNFGVVDSSCFEYYENKKSTMTFPPIFNNIKSIIDYIEYNNITVCTLYAIDKMSLGKIEIPFRFKALCGKMDDQKIHIYQIYTKNDGYLECRPSHPIPYINGSELGYYLPFMEKPEYLGKANIEEDAFGIWYGFVETNKESYGINISYLLNNGFNNIATYDIICDY